MAVTVPMLVAAFSAGVVARLWQEETSSQPAPGAVIVADSSASAPVQAPRASATRLVLTPASLHSDDEPEVASNRSLAPEPASRPSAKAEGHGTIEGHGAAETPAAPEAVAPAGSGTVVPSLGSMVLPSDPPADLKARPAQNTPPRRYVRKVIRKSAGYQTTEVPIFGPLFGWKF